ncbi:MAG: MATE family efflux transporter [Candidatus Rifleibacteriota bacterium]
MTQTKELENSPISLLLLKFSIPAITGTVITSFYNIVDRMFLGHYVGEAGIAATTVAMPMMMIIMAIGMLIGFGTNSQISIRLGEKKYEEAEKLLGQGLFLFFVTSVALSIVSLLSLDHLLRFFGATPEIMPFARPYLSIVLIGILPHQLSFGANSFIRGEGNPRTAMATMLIGGILNVILDYIFIARWGWGMQGAAWATVIGYSVSATWVIHYFVGGRSLVKFHGANFTMKQDSVRQVLLMGSPHFIMNMISSVQMSLFNNQLVKFGNNTSVSILGVIMSFNMIWLMPVIGISQGFQPIVGYNYGAKKPDRVRKAFILAIIAASVLCIFFFATIELFPRHIFMLFTSETDSEMVVEGIRSIRRFSLMLPFVGFVILVGNYFQFTGRPKISLTLTVVRQIVFLIPALLFLPNFLGINGVWYAMPTSDAGALILSLIFFFRELSLLKKQENLEAVQQ